MQMSYNFLLHLPSRGYATTMPTYGQLYKIISEKTIMWHNGHVIANMQIYGILDYVVSAAYQLPHCAPILHRSRN